MQVKSFAIFSCVQVCGMYTTMTKAVVDNIVLIDVLTHCALLHSVCDLKAVQVNIQQSNLIGYALKI